MRYYYPPSLSSSLVAWFLIHINVVFYCHLIINGILFAYLTLLLTLLFCVCARFSRHDFSLTPPNKRSGGRKSTALFEENLSLICCSCRGPFSQLKRTGFGSFPNETTTCYTWIGHLRGMVGHRGIWLSFPLWSAWGEHTAARRIKKKKYIFYISCLVLQHQKVQQNLVIVGEFPTTWSRSGFVNESYTYDSLSFQMSLSYFCVSATVCKFLLL